MNSKNTELKSPSLTSQQYWKILTLTGVIATFIGVIMLGVKPVLGFFLLLGGVNLLPPVRKQIQEKLKKEVGYQQFAGLFLFFLVIGIIFSSFGNNKNVATNSIINDGNTEAVAEVTSTKKEDEATKLELENWYSNSLQKITSEADESYTVWAKGLERGDVQASVDEANQLAPKLKEVQLQLDRLEAPHSLTEEEKQKINDGLYDMSVAYFARSTAVEQTVKYIETEDSFYQESAKKQLEEYNKYMLSGGAKIAEVMYVYNANIE